ncbi:hypothetical protein [Lichenifustis flavocetrariae]|uniref:Uncharacterized protein n=1 Tax=Lichenifustis flavocetrariae TaxID=2949735 RepID=A0AA42CNH8_9HYPH|nr:hypothetical protein [Lichenifustis flavocetrariae]MCW6509395.1 hypothetical protein [Lichenifustis flavocetrariae]
MTPDPFSSMPPRARHSAKGPGRAEPLDGEVIPPRIRVVNPEQERGPVPPVAPRSGFRMRLSTALLGVGFVMTLCGGGALEAYRWQKMEQARQAAMPSPTTVALTHLGKDLGELKATVESTRQDDTVRALKKSVDLLKAELDGLRSNDASAISQLTAKLDKAAQNPGPGLSDVMSRIDKIDHDPRLGEIAARLDRIEHQVSSPTPTGTVAVPAHSPAAQTVSIQSGTSTAPVTKPLKQAVLDNWIVRDVYSGIALVEGRSGGVREVVPGETLPGAGEVRSIERRGRAWIVVTSRGIIDTETW